MGESVTASGRLVQRLVPLTTQRNALRLIHLLIKPQYPLADLSPAYTSFTFQRSHSNTSLSRSLTHHRLSRISTLRQPPAYSDLLNRINLSLEQEQSQTTSQTTSHTSANMRTTFFTLAAIAGTVFANDNPANFLRDTAASSTAGNGAIGQISDGTRFPVRNPSLQRTDKHPGQIQAPATTAAAAPSSYAAAATTSAAALASSAAVVASSPAVYASSPAVVASSAAVIASSAPAVASSYAAAGSSVAAVASSSAIGAYSSVASVLSSVAMR